LTFFTKISRTEAAVSTAQGRNHEHKTVPYSLPVIPTALMLILPNGKLCRWIVRISAVSIISYTGTKESTDKLIMKLPLLTAMIAFGSTVTVFFWTKWAGGCTAKSSIT